MRIDVCVKTVFIMRGLPGAGKSYWVNVVTAVHPLLEEVYRTVVSADDFFKDPTTKEYKFDPARLREAHIATLTRYALALQNKDDLVFVDNTNLAAWEIAPYYGLAEVHGYLPVIVNVDAPLTTCLGRQWHGVPYAKMREMDVTFRTERFPPHWTVVRPEEITFVDQKGA